MRYALISEMISDSVAIVSLSLECNDQVTLSKFGISEDEAAEIVSLSMRFKNPERANKVLFQKIVPFKLH